MKRLEQILFVTASLAIFFLLGSAIVLGERITKPQEENAVMMRYAYRAGIDWEELYPYDTEVEMTEPPEQKAEPKPEIEPKEKQRPGTSAKLDHYIHMLRKYGRYGEDRIVKNGYYTDLSTAGYILTASLTDPSCGIYYNRLKNGHWVGAGEPKISLETCGHIIAEYASLQNYLADQGIDFLFVHTPSKECTVDDEFPDGYVSYANDNIDDYIQTMQELGLNYVDFRKTLHDEGLDHYGLFYLTDHHWKTETGLWSASEVMKEIEKRFGIEMRDPEDYGSYEKVTWPGAEFGSYGNGVTHYVADPEDFSVWIPKFDTKFRLEVPNRGVDETGTFEDVFLDRELLEYCMDIGGFYAYETILYGNQAYEKITNLSNPSGPKILMIRDSSSIAAVPYIALSCSEIVLLDTRPMHDDWFTGSIVNCINTFKPDVVLAFQGVVQKIQLNR